jgi:nitrogen fixation/metabolism regulation signal transduction histidine kinase
MDMHSSSQSYELAELKQAFLMLTSVSKKMESSYERLKAQAEELKQELCEKNARLVVSQQEQQRLESFLEGILQNMPVGIVVTDKEGRVRLVNQKAKDILDGGKRELLGVPYTTFEILAEIPLQFGASLEKKKGRSVYNCSVSSLNGFPENERGWVILIEDVSEITRWKALAERQKRLSSMGEMGARIAHEIRNPLGSMELNVAMLLEELEGNEALYALAGRLATGVRTVTQILSNLLHFAKGTDPRWERLDVPKLVREALEFTDPLLREKGIRVQEDYAQRGCNILGDRILLRQALLNLFLNAVEGMDPGGALRIWTVKQEETVGVLRGSPVMKVFVQDNGKGIPDGELERIFDPFFTTKSQGTGLGLAIVNNIVESHGGIVEVESRVGTGSSFVMSLPCQQEESRDGYAADPCSG